MRADSSRVAWAHPVGKGNSTAQPAIAAQLPSVTSWRWSRAFPDRSRRLRRADRVVVPLSPHSQRQTTETPMASLSFPVWM